MSDLDKTQHQRRTESVRKLEDVATCYPDEFVASLAKEFKIDAQKIDAMRKMLVAAGRIYREQKKDDQERPRAKQLRGEMQNVKFAAVTLDRRLERLTRSGAQLFWNPYEHISSETIHQPEGVNRFGLSFQHIRGVNGAVEICYLNPEHIREALRVIENLADYALKSIPREHRGARMNFPLCMWATNMENLFLKVLGRKFTHTPEGGEGKSKAFGFCKQAIKPLDPGVTSAALATAMRYAIRLSGRAKGRGSRRRNRKIAHLRS